MFGFGVVQSATQRRKSGGNLQERMRAMREQAGARAQARAAAAPAQPQAEASPAPVQAFQASQRAARMAQEAQQAAAHRMRGVGDMYGLDALTSVQAGQVRQLAMTVLLGQYSLVPSAEMTKIGITQPSSVASYIASRYATLRQGQLSAIPSAAAIAADPQLHALVRQYAPGSTTLGGGKGSGWLPANMGLTDKLIPGVPNYLLYAGAAVAGVFLWKKMKRRKK